MQASLNSFKFNRCRSCAFGLLLLFCASSQAADGVRHEVLFALINERLSYMEQVALYKYHNNMAVEDLERERQVVDDSKRSAAQQGLDPESIEAFFEAQIAVAKAIQYRYLADWLSTPVADRAPDLANQIRPALTELGDRIIANLSLLLQSGAGIGEQYRRAFYEAISVRHVRDSDKALLFESLSRVKTRTP